MHRNTRQETAMQEYYAGVDVSLELASVCIVDTKGKVVKETKVESHPDALVALFSDLRLPMAQIALEASPLSQWLHAGLTQAGFETVLLETRHVKAALSAMTVKIDRKDARGIAQLLRMGWFRPVHPKSVRSQEVRALLVARKLFSGFDFRVIGRGMFLRATIRKKGGVRWAEASVIQRGKVPPR